MLLSILNYFIDDILYNADKINMQVLKYIFLHSCLLHRTPASFKCEQVSNPAVLYEQFTSALSVPLHSTLFSRMGPLPGPNVAYGTACESGIDQQQHTPVSLLLNKMNFSIICTCMLATVCLTKNLQSALYPDRGFTYLAERNQAVHMLH